MNYLSLVCQAFFSGSELEALDKPVGDRWLLRIEFDSVINCRTESRKDLKLTPI